MIRFEDVTKRYADGTVAVDDLSLEVPRGGITVLVGPSGCGKTTSLRMINRMVEPTSGRILPEGEDISRRPAAQLRRQARDMPCPRADRRCTGTAAANSFAGDGMVDASRAVAR